MSSSRFDRYAGWVERRRLPILAAAGLLAAGGALLALRMPLLSDLANLLPPRERSVSDLERVEARSPVQSIALLAVEARDPGLRARAAHALADRIRTIDPRLVADVALDDGDARRFVWDHRFLFAPLGDLEAARDALEARFRKAKLRANPLYVSLEDEDEAAADEAADRDRLDKLRATLDTAQAKAQKPDEIVSRDGRLQLVLVQGAFPSATVQKGEELVAALDRAIADTRREVGPGVDIGMTEDVVIAVAEHRAVLSGMTLAVLLTVSIVGLSLFLYYRSLAALAALFGALAVGTLATFGFARLSIGHLNSVTAFLLSIVVGNGINFGILVLARHLEERRRGEPASRALAIALGGSFTGTSAAALAASVAYSSLVVTDFRAFRDFGVIGGAGMIFCWVAAYTVLPALLSLLEDRGLVPVRQEPAIGGVLARVLPRRPGRVLVAAGVLAAAGLAVIARYVASDPFEYDWQHLRADSGPAREASRWMARIDEGFGRQLVGGFMIGTGSVAEARAVAGALRARAEDQPGVPRGAALFRKVGALDDFVPADQPDKLAVLARIRKLCDDDAVAALDAKDQAEIRRLRPPDELRPFTAADVPAPLARRYTERDGTRGRLLYANQASRFDGWNGRHMIAFAAEVRALDLPAGTAMAGGAFVFADILHAIMRAGPRSTLAALMGVIIFIIAVLGPRRHAAVVLTSVAVGTTLMIAGAALCGLKINFLDFVALPITLGVGVDYAVNVVSREREEGPGSARRALSTTGGAVVLCSWTTTVGYGSLLLSANEGIRSFGGTAILGEVTCLLAALTLAPALLELLDRRVLKRPAGDALERSPNR